MIGVVSELGGDDRPLPGEEQELAIGAECADFIRGEQSAADMLLPEREAAFLRVEGAAHGLEHDGFLPRQIGDELGAVLIVDPEHLKDAGVRQESAGALSVECAELMDILRIGQSWTP